MGHLEVWVPGLPEAPLDAAREFHEQTVADVRKAFAKYASVTIVLPHADHPHRAWRLAAVQELAREGAPVRVNAIAGDSENDRAAIEEVLEFLRGSPGVTGQLLVADGKSTRIR